MARPLVFRFQGRDLSFTLDKVDRSKLYGYKEELVLDEDGGECELATLAEDGRTVVGRGGTGIGYLTADLEWTDKSQLTPVDVEGKKLTAVPSSFTAPIELLETVNVEKYLEHNVRLIYELQIDDDISDLANELKNGTIYSFPYSYRGGLEADTGFLLMGDDGGIFLGVGNPTSIEFVGLAQSAAVVEEDTQEDETDLMDFDMI